MNKNIITLMFILGTIFLLSGCNQKKSHFENGGDLICTNNSLFSENTVKTINTNNSYYSSKLRPRHSKDGFYYGDNFLNISNTYFDIDNCEIK